jgi:hypothetical protein
MTNAGQAKGRCTLVQEEACTVLTWTLVYVDFLCGVPDLCHTSVGVPSNTLTEGAVHSLHKSLVRASQPPSDLQPADSLAERKVFCPTGLLYLPLT